ncbi:unnamed protein product [Nippostrongylus brasiliensis]|uniref:GST N-terminal domain-containing protein n=1 Tax=Nippostrongylus brasiliensis TaxID=27835 RepID=A0A0N4XS08_NIPBR|nr:unnamed protein product [Nippostrongylus brasiliensis]
MHPEGKVPVLEHHHQTIIDSALIAEYLDWVYPESSVLPTDPYERARQRMIASHDIPLKRRRFFLSDNIPLTFICIILFVALCKSFRTQPTTVFGEKKTTNPPTATVIFWVWNDFL